MNFIRRYLKKLIAEAIKENFPPMNISIQDTEENIKKFSFDHCIINDGSVRVGNIKDKKIEITNCIVKVKDNPPLFADLSKD